MITIGGVVISGTVFSGGKVVGQGNLLQTKSDKIIVDTTTTSTSYVTLMTVDITTKDDTALMIQFAANLTFTFNNGRINAEITVDGTREAAGSVAQNAGSAGESHGLVVRVTGLAAGTHTLLVRWKVPFGTGRCRPVTAPDDEGAAVLVSEVAA